MDVIDDQVGRPEKLADLLADFALAFRADFHVQDTLDGFVTRIIGVLPVTGAAVKLTGAAEELHVAAASDATTRRLETLQIELGEGPCIEACRSGEELAVSDLGGDERFGRFAVRACDAGVAAVFTFPMSLKGNLVGALNLYRDEPGGLDAWSVRWARVLADVAAAYVDNAQRRSDADQTMDMLRQRSLHDPLTGLANSTLFKERLEHAVAMARRSHQVVAVLFVDLDRFKSVNDGFGHHVGDKLLVAVAERLKKITRAGDTLCRLSGDEFVLLCEDLKSVESAKVAAERVVTALGPVFDLDGVILQVTASVGVAFAGPGDEMPENLLRQADFAMYQAKQAGGAQHQMLNIASRLSAEPQGMRQVDDSSDDLAGSVVDGEVADERPVDLEDVERKPS